MLCDLLRLVLQIFVTWCYNINCKCYYIPPNFSKPNTNVAHFCQNKVPSVFPSVVTFPPIAERVRLRTVDVAMEQSGGQLVATTVQHKAARDATQRDATRRACRTNVRFFERNSFFFFRQNKSKKNRRNHRSRGCMYARKNMSVRERRSLVLMGAWWTR